MKYARHSFTPVRPLAVLLATAALLVGAGRVSAAPAPGAPAPATPVPDTLDLRTAIQFALENNFAIRQARERIREQEGIVLEVSSRQIPNVGANGAYQLNEKAISQSFPASDRAWQINVTASQVLYAGGGVRSAVRSSRLAQEAAILDLQATINEALLQVRTAFYRVLLAREQVKVQESNLQLLESQLQTATDRFRAGTVSSFEQLRAEVAVANAKVPLITARNDYRLAMESLRQVTGFTTADRSNLSKMPNFDGTLQFTPTQFELQSAFEAARANRPDLQRLTKLVEAGEEGITVARAGYFPTISAFGGWALRKGTSSAFRDSPEGFLGGVQGQWNIFDGRATTGRVRQARSRAEQTRLALEEAQLAVDIDVRASFSQWQEANELVESSQRVVEQATEAVRLAQARYAAGTSTQLDVLQAQVELTTARTNQLQAFFNYNVAVAQLRRAMGLPDEFVTRG